MMKPVATFQQPPLPSAGPVTAKKTASQATSQHSKAPAMSLTEKLQGWFTQLRTWVPSGLRFEAGQDHPPPDQSPQEVPQPNLVEELSIAPSLSSSQEPDIDSIQIAFNNTFVNTHIQLDQTYILVHTVDATTDVFEPSITPYNTHSHIESAHHLLFKVSPPKFASSACGLRLSASSSREKQERHRLCHIGGLIIVEQKDKEFQNETVAFVTTAHGLIDLLRDVNEADEFSKSSQSSTHTDSENENHNEEGESKKTKDKDIGSNEYLHDQVSGSNAEDIDHQDSFKDLSLEIGSWTTVEPVFPIQFTETRWLGPLRNNGNFTSDNLVANREIELLTAEDATCTADFALFSRKGFEGLRNYYSATEQPGKIIYVQSSIDNDRLSEGDAHLVLDPERSSSCHLLKGIFPIHIGKATFETRRIIMEKPLAQGASGSWVVRGGDLCGSVIMISRSEPTALIMTAEDLFESIQRASISPVTARVASALDMEIIRMRPWSQVWAQISMPTSFQTVIQFFDFLPKV
ncbi:hypothetical protein CORC01_14273 [Colletotrichum orchidophilum]|uniref:Uncharacterized protein n=1 Tax=Colletotrichum orchidophilum TaxID=1209926 RepID=A0A1G4AMT4_9PEZI|nr:uncharacterized protein CORC01_14273 [Colletotrichum orchidophilum]OHE90431.1 hypothetical protein CORC01_14273 [Colletotrichum orchidophilum]